MTTLGTGAAGAAEAGITPVAIAMLAAQRPKIVLNWN